MNWRNDISLLYANLRVVPHPMDTLLNSNATDVFFSIKHPLVKSYSKIRLTYFAILDLKEYIYKLYLIRI